MNNNRQTQPQPPPGMTVSDIYYVVFRHKWKIILLSVAGILAAAAYYFLNPPPYQSQAELMIQYVPEAGALSLTGSGQKVLVPDSRGDDIINSEIQILTSMDSRRRWPPTSDRPASWPVPAAAATPPPPRFSCGTTCMRNRLNGEATSSRSHSTSQSAMVQPILQETINDYFQKHNEIHRRRTIDEN